MIPAPSAGGRKFLFLLSGSRRGGTSEALARRAAESLLPGDLQRWMHLSDFPLPPFQDTRGLPHEMIRTTPEDPQHQLLQATIEASDLVLVAPLYWYSLPASAKLYLDYWSSWLHLPGLDFAGQMRGKTLRVITTFSGSDPADTRPLVDCVRLTAKYLDIRYAGCLIGATNHQSPSGQIACTSAATFLLPLPSSSPPQPAGSF